MRVDAQLSAPRRLSLTPLIDVVFLLLIFFMLASTFMKFTHLEVSGSRPGQAAVAVRGALFIRLHSDGRMDLNGAPVSRDDLIASLDSHADEADNANARLIVRPMDGVSVQQLVSALAHIRRSKIQHIIMAR